MAGNAFYAFGEGFLNSLNSQMQVNAEERRAQRARMVERYGAAVEAYRASRTQAAQTLEMENMFKEMGLSPQIAALAAYEGVKPSEVGAYARRFVTSDNGTVEDKQTGETVDVAKLTGQVPETPIPQERGTGAPTLVQDTVNAQAAPAAPAAQDQPLPPAGQSLDPTQALQYTMPQDHRDFLGRMLGKPDMGADSAYAIREVANMYGVDPQDILSAINTPLTQQLPDVSGVRAKSDIELALEEKAAGLRGGGGAGKPDDFSFSTAKNAFAALFPSESSGFDAQGNAILSTDERSVYTQGRYNQGLQDWYHTMGGQSFSDSAVQYGTLIGSVAQSFGTDNYAAMDIVNGTVQSAATGQDFNEALAANAQRVLSAADGTGSDPEAQTQE